jgi:hypothetical protein
MITSFSELDGLGQRRSGHPLRLQVKYNQSQVTAQVGIICKTDILKVYLNRFTKSPDQRSQIELNNMGDKNCPIYF